ncbi:MAPEG family protein [Aurantiacibacter aquimixticola]|uniref:MAPEG family protein n=1 Tax=Aurantiacibacter aquimixticola TaxID=1958945 RepID=A0A419RSC0_9SPHN|nr:MAPEG family protein [Aurantiacibacter aquimixticola]RJY08680.1 MAPEG family protein [Aurantiacibacter aquimixticola]
MNLLQPVIVLAAWTMVMWLWMYVTRLPAMSKAGVDPDSLARDPHASLDTALPPKVQWKAHNYNHLHEAPTVFYALALALALLDLAAGLPQWIASSAVVLAWAYVVLRILHSLVQALINKVVQRFAIFSLSSLVLIALVGLAIIAAF